MNSAKKNIEPPLFPYRRHYCPIRISHLLEACQNSKNLVIGIYQISEQRFLYCSDNLKELAGSTCHRLLDNGWDAWFTQIDSNERFWIKGKILNFLQKPFKNEVLSLKYHFKKYNGKKICLKHEMQHHKLDTHLLTTNYFYDVTEMETIENYLNATAKPAMDSKELVEELSISSREKEVLHLIANGFSSKEIAHRLFISDHTAISHRKNLIEKFKVKNTAHLIKRASEVIPLF